jgi:hypothetical protein
MDKHRAASQDSIHQDLAAFFSSATALSTLHPGQINDLNIFIDKVCPCHRNLRVRVHGWQVIRVYAAFQQVINLVIDNEIHALRAADVTITEVFTDMMTKYNWLECGNRDVLFANGELKFLIRVKPGTGIKRVLVNNGYPLHQTRHEWMSTDTECNVKYSLDIPMHMLTYFALLAACETLGLDHLFNDCKYLIFMFCI